MFFIGLMYPRCIWRQRRGWDWRMRQRRGQALRYCGREYDGWDPDSRLSSVREGNKDEDALRDDDGCSLPRLLALAAVWGWLVEDWAGGFTVVLILYGVGGFPSLSALALTGLLRWPRNLTSKPQNRPTTPSQ